MFWIPTPYYDLFIFIYEFIIHVYCVSNKKAISLLKKNILYIGWFLCEFPTIFDSGSVWWN